MIKLTLKSILFLLVMAVVISCENNKNTGNKQVSTRNVSSNTSEPFSAYKILKAEPYETRNKSQVKCYAYLTTDTVSKDRLSATLNKIYSELRDYNNFKNFSAPSVIAIYVYTSKEKSINMTESWIAMLSKTPSDNQPRISFDDLKVKALESAMDNEKSDDEKKYEELTEYLRKRRTDLCFIYKTLYDLEGTSIKQADIKYPDFGTEHSEYQSKLYRQEKKKLFDKYNINDTLSSYITVFGMSYCK